VLQQALRDSMRTQRNHDAMSTTEWQ
jgi:hypothetical protein